MNLQTLPRDDKVVKAAFEPKLDAFLSADYSNIELRLLAFYLEQVGHPSMADVFRAGGDLHRETAAGIYRKPAASVTDAERQVGKRLNFSIVYGGGIPTLVKQLGIKPKDALELLRAYHGQWPGIGWSSKKRPPAEGTLIDWIIKRLNERERPNEPGYITTLYGRHLHPRSLHSALNALCQGCAADLKKWAMIQCHEGLAHGCYPGNGVHGWERRRFKSHLVNEVHDELVFDCAEPEIPFVAKLVPEWMTDERIDSVVPIRPECDISWTTLAEKTPYAKN